jgi:hypothetical protein
VEQIRHRIQSSGGAGSLGVTMRLGRYGAGNRKGVLFGLGGAVAWQAAQLDSGDSEQFGFAQAGGSLGAWAGPAYLGAEVLAYFVHEPGARLVASSLDRSIGATLMGVVAVQENLFVQVKYLPTDELITSSEAFEVRLVASFAPF